MGVSATAIYRHFADRNALVAAAQADRVTPEERVL